MPRRQQILEADAAEQLRPHAVGHAVDDLRTVLRGIDVGAERTLAVRQVHDLRDRLGHRSGVLPPTINLDQADEEFDDLDLIGPEPRVRAIDYAMANGFGFGGVNASVLLKRWTT